MAMGMCAPSHAVGRSMSQVSLSRMHGTQNVNDCAAWRAHPCSRPNPGLETLPVTKAWRPLTSSVRDSLNKFQHICGLKFYDPAFLKKSFAGVLCGWNAHMPWLFYIKNKKLSSSETAKYRRKE